MSNDIVIRVENVSKQYRLGLVGTGTISQDLNRLWARLRGKEDPTLRIGETNDRAHAGESEYVWALKDINFEVKRGEVLGIIGRNGAGKSTLLKILSRVTAPTTGEIIGKGRIASLLEVGTGFHPELTGRENIYLNGAINGMTKSEVKAKLDEIVDFSGCERYIDTPVKRYSSGMMVRLGFSVAAHLEPEILIVDEVLAVGDAEFQKKCIGKMQDVAGHGRTVLFVSHNMAAVQALCTQGLIIENGQIRSHGTATQCVNEYLRGRELRSTGEAVQDRQDRKGNGFSHLVSVQLNTSVGNNTVKCGSSLDIRLDFECRKPVHAPLVYVGILDQAGTEVVHINSKMNTFEFPPMAVGPASVQCTILDIPLVPGAYYISAGILDGKDLLDLLEDVAMLTVVEGDFFGTGYLGPAVKGQILMHHKWALSS